MGPNGFKMWPIYNETAVLEKFLSWLNCVFTTIWNAISVLERFFHIATETAIAIKTTFESLGL